MRLALAQINTTVGDIAGNTAKIAARVEEARGLGVDIIAFPELTVTGYPPEDLLLKPDFVRENIEAIRRLSAKTRGITAIVGFADWRDDLYNAAAILHDGEWVDTCHKVYLPNYGVFDEERYFRPGESSLLLRFGDIGVGVSICEDMWYTVGPNRSLGLAGALIQVNLSASPYFLGKPLFREKMLATRASDNCCALAYVNAVGGQDELVFDGQSLVVDVSGEVVCRGRAFDEDLLVFDIDPEGVRRHKLHDPRKRKEKQLGFDLDHITVRELELPPLSRRSAAVTPVLGGRRMEPAEEIYHALVLGTRDYVRKNGFKKVIFGLSGGIDSTLVACIAVDALGADCVTGVYMPSRYSTPEGRQDAQHLAANLGIEFLEVPIDRVFQCYLDNLAPLFKGRPEDVTEENIQARIRANILFALSNKFGGLVLATGDKSEMAVGFTTLYGDMAGGFAVIKDVPKTMVYELARYRNGLHPVIPDRVFAKPPSPELRAGQKTTDSLPPYEVLDPIMKAYVEDDKTAEDIVAMGLPPETVCRVIKLIDSAEYKRRQAAPGIKVSPRAFGRDRRMPITNHFGK